MTEGKVHKKGELIIYRLGKYIAFFPAGIVGVIFFNKLSAAAHTWSHRVHLQNIPQCTANFTVILCHFTFSKIF